MTMTYVIIFCVFLASTMFACIIADARNIRQECERMRREHDLELRKLNADFHDKAFQLYIRYGKIL